MSQRVKRKFHEFCKRFEFKIPSWPKKIPVQPVGEDLRKENMVNPQSTVSEVEVQGSNVKVDKLTEGKTETANSKMSTVKVGDAKTYLVKERENRVNNSKANDVGSTAAIPVSPVVSPPVEKEEDRDKQDHPAINTDSKFSLVEGETSEAVDYNNSMFRYYIWRDMVEELWQEKPIFGINFGKPQRSKSIEIMRQAVGEWSRDGWIASHNSYLEVIYRAGVVGVMLLILLVGNVSKITKTFLKEKSLTGVLLLSVVFFWLVSASLIIIFEMPYFAIPLWSLYGIVLAYANKMNTHQPKTKIS